MRGRYLLLITAWIAGLSLTLPWVGYDAIAMAHSHVIPGAEHRPPARLFETLTAATATDRRQVLSQPPTVSVVINEIGWGGTAAGAADEWIELYNTTDVARDLSGWRLRAADGLPNIALEGTIEPFGYYLVERTDDTTISDIDGDLLTSFGTGLANAGETLYLLDAFGATVDSANGDGGPWPNGDEGAAPAYRSLERVSPWAADVDAHWVSNDGSITNGLDAEGHPICGTPRSANAAYLTHAAPYADLEVDKRGPATAVGPEMPITFSLTVTNTGTATATETLLTDSLTDALAFVSQTSDLPTGSPVPFDEGPAALTWHLGDLAPSATAHVTLVVRRADPASWSGPITNTAVVATTANEVDLGDNESTCAVELTDSGKAHVLISGVLYDGYQVNDDDEAVELVNDGAAAAHLNGWSLCKDVSGAIGCWPLPSIEIAPGARVWIAKDPAAFALSFGSTPDYVMDSWPRLANTGDEVILRSPDDFYVDVLVYGDGASDPPGWSGAPLQAYTNHLRGQAGQILSRKRDEITGLPLADTDASGDWIQSLEDPNTGRRVRYPGWDLDALSLPLAVMETATVVVGIAPDNAFEVVSATLQSARHAISIEVYSLRHPALVDLLAAKARQGVNVTVLLEGDPVGVGIDTTEWQTELYACQTIEQAGGACWFMVHETADRRYNRYEYVHAKMIVVDDSWVLVGSQNLTPDGLPGDDKTNGTFGSRGIVVATTAPSAVERAAQVFALDCDPTVHTDLVEWNTLYPERYGPPTMELVDLTPIDGVSTTVTFPRPMVVTGPLSLELFTAPEAALRSSDALLGLLGRAGQGDAIYVEQLYEHLAWGEDPTAAPNLRLQAYIAAARRGARVRILLNGQSFVEGGPDVAEESLATVRYVNELARQERLDLRAALGNPTGQGIHNKMVLVDLGSEDRTAHVGSVNGSEASSKINREIALQVTSDAVYTYLAHLFAFDWWRSNPLYLPLIVQAYQAPDPPVPHMVISEVAYTGVAATEWIELYNPTPDAIDLSEYKLGDAENRDSYEPMFSFPPGTVVAGQQTLVIAVNATQVSSANLEFYDSDPAVADMVPYPAWGSLDYPLGLRNLGDHVLLLGPDDTPVDVVIWGDATFEGVMPHPGVIVSGASLERFPSHADTDDCMADFRERYPPTPGEPAR